MADLEPGKSYRFKHKRKGEFVAKLLALRPTDPGDQEPFFYEVQIAYGGNLDKGAEKLIRPSLVESVEAVDG